VVAEMFKTDRAKFDQQARNWTEFFAVEASGSAAAIASLTEMGFNEEQAKAALTSAGGNVEQALELLFSGAAASPS